MSRTLSGFSGLVVAVADGDWYDTTKEGALGCFFRNEVMIWNEDILLHFPQYRILLFMSRVTVNQCIIPSNP